MIGCTVVVVVDGTVVVDGAVVETAAVVVVLVGMPGKINVVPAGPTISIFDINRFLSSGGT